MTMSKLCILSACALAGLFPAPGQAQKPLSCEMQMMLNGLTAWERDQGVSRTQGVVARNTDGELTQQEIKQILDRVYVHQRSRTPDQIKDEVYRKCQGNRK